MRNDTMALSVGSLCSQHNNLPSPHYHHHHYRSKSTSAQATSTTTRSTMLDISNSATDGTSRRRRSNTTAAAAGSAALQYQSSTPINTFDRMSAAHGSSSSLFLNAYSREGQQIRATTATSCSLNHHRHKSPFTRGQSRVFYASEVGGMLDYSVDRRSPSPPPPPPPPRTTPCSSFSGSGQFRRSEHRSNSSYKSQDSGFSDSGVGGGGSGEVAIPSVSGTVVEDLQTSRPPPIVVEKEDRLTFSRKTDHSPAKKLAKWSSSATSPLKMLWRQQDGSRLSVLKCCAGMNPIFPFYHKQIKCTEEPNSHEQSSIQIHFSPNENNNNNNNNYKSNNVKNDDCRETMKQGSADSSSKDESCKMLSSTTKLDHTGTWPRVRKTAHDCCKDDSPSSVDALANLSSVPHQKFGTYFSTRLKGHQKPRVLFREDDANKKHIGLHHSQAQFRDTLFVRSSSVQLWLRDLHWSTEGECMNTLQSKAVAKDLADVSVITTKNANDAILLLSRRNYNMKIDLENIKRKIDKNLSKSALNDCDNISLGVRSLLCDCRSQQFKEVPAVQKYFRLFFAHCGILKQLLDRVKNDAGSSTTTSDAPSPLDAHFALETAFNNLYGALVLCHLKNIVDILEDPLSVRSLKVAVTCIGVLGVHDNVLSHLITKTGAIRSLLTICIERKYRSIRSMILRSLAMLCCNEESIRELEESGGIECITEILAERVANEAEKCEAAGVIAQITSPLLDNSPNVMGLTENIASLIQSLTELAGSTKSYEGFLLSTAAMGNLTFMVSDACHHLHECKTTSVLVSACRQGKVKSESVFIKDQVATILANMASIPKGRDDIIQSGGLVVLLCFLQIKPSMVQSKVEVAACERVQQKSAIALSRLCSDVKIAEQVVSLQGVQRLVRLCKDEKERNESDAVLVACLAVLRKIASACGLEEFKDLNATELVEPRLLDSFLIYSSRQESYV